MNHVTLLERGGFLRVGCWSAVPGGNQAALDGLSPKAAGVYAHVVDGVVCYVGSAQRGLSGRMRHYARTESKRTAWRVRQQLLAALAAGCLVEVYMLVPDATELKYKQLPVDVIAGVEEGLIRHLRPIWNIRGLGRV